MGTIKVNKKEYNVSEDTEALIEILKNLLRRRK